MRTCKECGKKGKWHVYVIWDRDNPKIGTGKHKHWLCPECDKMEVVA